MPTSPTSKTLPKLPRPLAVLGASLGAGILWILLLTAVLARGSRSATLLLDYGAPETAVFPYPLTIQNLLYLLFAVSLGQLYQRWRCGQWEADQLEHALLPEDDQTVLQSHDLPQIRRKVSGMFDGDNGFLASLIDLCILQFQASRSVDQTVSVLNSSLELLSHRVDLRYSLLRYTTWVIPSVGFIGTVVGISAALHRMDPDSLDPVLAALAVAFNTTIVALALSSVLMFLLQHVQSGEERSLNQAGDYCLRNLINRLFAGEAHQGD